MSNIKIWFLETRPQFLLLSIVLVLYGSAIAYYEGSFNLFYFLLSLVGLMSLHIATNVLNDYYDYKSGLDFMTKRTPFSGGSGILTAGKLDPQKVYSFGIFCIIIGLATGIYFLIVRGALFLPIIILGGIAVCFYNTYLSKKWLGEIFAGLGMGALPVLGTYFIQTGHYSWAAIIAAIPSGILTHNLLLLNEFPDFEPDKKTGKKNFVISLGKKNAGILYSILILLIYVIIGIGVTTKLMPAWALVSFLTLPLAMKAVQGAIKYYDSFEKLIPSLGANVLTNLLTQVLLAVGYILSKSI